jgi:hypothetical protein
MKSEQQACASGTEEHTMITTSHFTLKFRIMAGFVLGLVMLAGSGSLLAQQDYVGAEYCANCHPLDPSEADNGEDWRTSGHRFILQEAELAQHRALPLPEGFSWDDISYVVGGHSAKAVYLDDTGHIITSTVDREGNPVDGLNQYNLLTGEWSDFHPGEDKAYDCGRCHTTGFNGRGLRHLPQASRHRRHRGGRRLHPLGRPVQRIQSRRPCRAGLRQLPQPAQAGGVQYQEGMCGLPC